MKHYRKPCLIALVGVLFLTACSHHPGANLSQSSTSVSVNALSEKTTNNVPLERSDEELSADLDSPTTLVSNYGKWTPVDTSTDTDETPPLLPMYEGEAPISTITSPQYPDALSAEIVLYDVADNVRYEFVDYVKAGNFQVYAGHKYEMMLFLSSDGVVKDIQLTTQVPEGKNNETAMIHFLASDHTTTQTLLAARIFMKADCDAFILDLSDEMPIEEETYLGDIDSIPICISFGFTVLEVD